MFFVHTPVGWMCHSDKLPEGIYVVMTIEGGTSVTRHIQNMWQKCFQQMVITHQNRNRQSLVQDDTKEDN